MALPTGGYTFTPQTANLGASPLSALKPLDVGVSVSFTPMPKYEVPSARSELVSVGMAQGLQGFSEPIISAYKALDDESKKKEDDALKYLRDVNLAKIKAEKTPMELAYEKARYDDLTQRTKDRGGDKVPVKTRSAGSLSPDIVRSSDSDPLPEDPERKIDFNEESLVPPTKDEELPPYKPVGALFDISYQPRVVTKPEPIISEDQIAAVTNPPLANMQAATGGVMVPSAPIPEATPTPTPEVRAAIPVTTQPTSFKATPDQLAKIEENRLKMIEEMISKAPQDQQVQQPAQQNVDDTIGELTDLAYESAADARKAVSKIKKLLPSYKESKITPQYDERLGKRVFFVEQPESDDKYVAPGSTPKLNKEQVQMVLSMQDNLRQDPLYSKALTFRDSKDTILASLEKQDGFSDIAAINAFQRLIDPGVAVREGDVALIQSAISFFNKYDPKFITESFSKGSKLPPADREKMRKLTMELTRMGLEKANKEIIPRFTQMASDAGLNPDYVIKPFDIPLDKTQLTKEIDVLEARMRGIPKSQSNDPAAIEMINKRNSLKTQLLQAK
jgi:hypothetical protein